MTNLRDLVNTHQALKTLNVDSDSSLEEIKVAYRKLALEYHPDKNTTEQEGIQFKKITEAYHVIKNHYKEGKKPTTTNQHKRTEDFKKQPRWGARPGQEPRVQPNLFVDVDESLCIGCCSCETIAPDVFAINKNSKMNPKSSVINQKGAGANKIMNAAKTCPTKAIKVENKDTREKLYPF
jgi:ferredoxin